MTRRFWNPNFACCEEVKEAQVVIEQWRKVYNTIRPNSCAGISPPRADDLDGGGMIFPSPARSWITPVAAGVQALPMNSLHSAWTPLLAGLKTFHQAGEGKSEAHNGELTLCSDWYKISVRAGPTPDVNSRQGKSTAG